MAENEAAAPRETAGPDLLELGFLTRPWVDVRRVSMTPLPTTLEAANMRSARIAELGASSELLGACPYELTQKWARAWDDEGYEGVAHRMRFAANKVGLALFGPAGPLPDAPRVEGVPAEDVAEAAVCRSSMYLRPPPCMW